MNRLLALLALLFPAPLVAQEAPLVADVSEHLVAITAGFTGKDVLLFGAIDAPGDIVVVVKGPPQDTTVHRKERIGPIWMNTEAATFRDVPSYYHVATTRPVEEFVSDVLAARFQVGIQHLRIEAENGVNVIQPADPSEAPIDFRQALVRLKSENALYDPNIGTIGMMSDRLFRTNLHFPANSPPGTYIVEVYLFRGGTVASAVIVPFIISKIGVGADITEFAKNYDYIYGLLAIFLAIAAGWGAGEIFRRV
jgi:uncharacterized protein (TIGR02186 family)